MPAAAAAPTALPPSFASPFGIVAMYASYAVWTVAACAGTRATRTSRAACATAASADAPGGAVTPVANGSRPPSIAATASYIAPCTIPPSTLLAAGARPTAIAFAATPLQWTTAFSPGADDDVVGPSASTATAASVAVTQSRSFSTSILLLTSVSPAQTGSLRRAARESWKPQLFAAKRRASSARERTPSLR